jgi:hypothetical protein
MFIALQDRLCERGAQTTRSVRPSGRSRGCRSSWQHPLAVHHATAGDLNRRGIGDITTLTVWGACGDADVSRATIGCFAILCLTVGWREYPLVPSPGIRRQRRQRNLAALRAASFEGISWQEHAARYDHAGSRNAHV